jgi:hypothetical protein
LGQEYGEQLYDWMRIAFSLSPRAFHILDLKILKIANPIPPITQGTFFPERFREVINTVGSTPETGLGLAE